eukprot:m.49563 g.49563  ORF g.49563 m.49563 type:complete len:505 (-) comp11504_c0_seq2:35-1549(-)
MGDDLYDNYGDNAQSYEPKYEYSEASGLANLVKMDEPMDELTYDMAGLKDGGGDAQLYDNPSEKKRSAIEEVASYYDNPSTTGRQDIYDPSVGALYDSASSSVVVSADNLPKALANLARAGEAKALRQACLDIVHILGGALVDPAKAAVRAAAVSGGAIERIVAAMGRHPGDADLQRDGAKALRYVLHFDVGTSAKSQFVAARAPAAILAAMREHPTRADVQACACGAMLAATAGNAIDGTQGALGTTGGLAQIATAIRAHPADVDLVDLAIQAVANLTLQNPSNKSLFGQSQGFEALVAGQRAHPGSARLQQLGSQTIAGLITNATSQEQAAIAGVIELLVASLGAHAKDPLVTESVCEALQNLVANNFANKERVGKAGGLKAVAGAMRALPTNSVVQIAGCNALRSICTNEAANQTQAVPAGAHDAIAAAMKAFPADEALQLAAVKALLGLVANQPPLQQRASRLASLVQRAQRQFPGNKELQDRSRDLLGLINKKKGCAIL